MTTSNDTTRKSTRIAKRTRTRAARLAEPNEATRAVVAVLGGDPIEMPSVDQLYNLLMSDHPFVWWLWWRAVDWALYRVRHGLPIERGMSDDAFQERLNARFEALADRLDLLRHTTRPCAEIFPEPHGTFSMATTIERWRKGPPTPPPPLLTELCLIIDRLAEGGTSC